MLFGCDAKMLGMPKHKSKECYYGEGFRDYTDYCKYIYDEKSIAKFENHAKFKEVEETDIEFIKTHFVVFEDWIKDEEFYDKYDFDYLSQIKLGDYFYIYNKNGNDVFSDDDINYDVYYVDMSKCILYFIHLNT